MDTIGARLRAERERLGLSQEEFAKKCGVHRRTQVNYELDRRTPPGDYLEAIESLGADSVFVVSGSRVNFPENERDAPAAFVAHHLLRVLGVADGQGSLKALADELSDAVVNAEVTGDQDPLDSIAAVLRKHGAGPTRLSDKPPDAVEQACTHKLSRGDQRASGLLVKDLLLQMVPGDRWDAVFDGSPKSRVPLVAWAMVRGEDGAHSIKGVIVGPGATKLYCEDQPEFLCYVPRAVPMP